jgi:hypothetical protein
MIGTAPYQEPLTNYFSMPNSKAAYDVIANKVSSLPYISTSESSSGQNSFRSDDGAQVNVPNVVRSSNFNLFKESLDNYF